jgi:hypothetical protein
MAIYISMHFCFHATIVLTAAYHPPHPLAALVIPPTRHLHAHRYRQKPWLLLPKSEQLRGRFGIPSFDRETRTFLVAGRMMSKLIERKAPHQRHVFCSPDLRFLVWRSPDGVQELKSIFLLHATAVEPGISVCVMRMRTLGFSFGFGFRFGFGQIGRASDPWGELRDPVSSLVTFQS